MLSLPAAAQGMVIPPPGVATDPNWLTLDYHRVTVTIENQVATTQVAMQFTNNGTMLAEGTFIFPLPKGAAVEQLTMYVNGQAIEAKILPADEARGIYNEIVRQYRDPALLEYIGQDVIQASVFPIPMGESRKIDIAYGQVLEAENGLLKYVYPMNAGSTARFIGQMSISVHVVDDDNIRNVYSPTHNIVLSRMSDTAIRTGFEATNYLPQGDFTLFYGTQRELIDINMLTYRASAAEDGFFLMMVQPPLFVTDEQITPKDVVIVLDQSGSMSGSKWEQAQAAAAYILDNLNPQDRFNVVVFSTGWRVYANELLTAENAAAAKDWIDTLFAEGGTDIHGGLSTALSYVQERPFNILFLTDGLATEGIVETPEILSSLNTIAPPNARIFTFGVGDDVDTFLLDAIVRDFRGSGSYVRPTERIDEEVASLYNKISAPVMTDITLTIDGVQTELLYPRQISDLFAGEQLTIVGRYRGSAENVTVNLTGMIDGIEKTITYPGNVFSDVAGGEAFIARLWATRRIGDLLNTIRLNGESQELIDSIVSLSIRYGIITPYTSFLIEEDDILSQAGRDRAAAGLSEEAEALASESTGASAVDAADTTLNLQSANAPAPAAMPTMTGAMGGLGGETDTDESFGYVASPIQTVGDKTFILQGDVWTDTTFAPDTMTTEKVIFLSDAYFALLTEYPEAGDFFALGERVIVVLGAVAYEVVTE
jgi:Ca-activated chloride channel family protein